MKINNDTQRRNLNFTLNSNVTQKRIDTDYYLEGMATTFDEPYKLYSYGGVDFFEMIASNCLDGADMTDVVMLYDHESRVMARITNFTLYLEVRPEGLFFYADLSKSDFARSLYEDVKNGLITKMSWSFSVKKWGRDEETNTDIVEKVGKVYDISLVSIPANDNTSVQARKQQHINEVNVIEKRKRLEIKLKLMEV